MGVLVGIDEAGYGPILGPLVVSSVAFSVPDNLLRADMWEILSPAVGKNKRRLGGRLLITDSKKAYSKSAGIGHLRRTVLAGLMCLEESPAKMATAGDLVGFLSGQCAGRLAEYPWYKTLSDKELGGNRDDIELASVVLNNTLAAKEMRLLSMRSICLDVGHYNRMVSVVRNKASVLFTAVASLIKSVFESSYARRESGVVQIVIDRQGGRTRYRAILERMFDGLDLKIIREDNAVSSYELGGCGKVMRLHFAMGADEKYLPVSLASMTSKYVRQELVGAINAYFISHCAHLKPTAGYWKDGLRFIKDVENNLPNLRYDSEKLVRSR